MHIAIQSLILQRAWAEWQRWLSEIAAGLSSLWLLLLAYPHSSYPVFLGIASKSVCVLTSGNLSRFSVGCTQPTLPSFTSHWGYVGTLWKQRLKLLSFTPFPCGFYQVWSTLIDYIAYTFTVWFLKFVLIIWCFQYLLYPFIIHNNS